MREPGRPVGHTQWCEWYLTAPTIIATIREDLSRELQMSMPLGSGFANMSVQEVQHQLEHVHRTVARHRGRVEICCGEFTSVLISKDELLAMEEALEILANTADFRMVAQTISQLARTGMPEPARAN